MTLTDEQARPGLVGAVQRAAGYTTAYVYSGMVAWFGKWSYDSAQKSWRPTGMNRPILQGISFSILAAALAVLAVGCSGRCVENPRAPLIKPVLDNDVECVRSLIQRGVDVDQRAGGTGTTALKSAAAYDRTEITQILLEHGADPNRGSSRGLTPLHSASYWGNVAAVKLLLGAGATVDPIDPGTGFTPLMDAALKGHREIVQLLLAAGADPARRDIGGQTAADKARQRGFQQVDNDIEAWARRRRP